MLAVNGSHTYVIFNYENDGLEWGDNAVIGYTSADRRFFYNHPLSGTAAVVAVSSSLNASNTGIVGKLVYSLSAKKLPSINCSESLQKPIGFIVSPFYPDRYPNNTNCVWEMSLETPHQIILSFNVFALENSDFLYVYDNSTEAGDLILSRTGKCATNPNSSCPWHDFHAFIAKKFSLQFISDLFRTDRGFNVTFEIHQIGE